MAGLRVDAFEPRVWRRSPRFAPLAGALGRFDGAEAWPEVAAYDHPAAPVRFVPQVRVDPGVPGAPSYDARIVLRGEVPTRAACWHDLFNAMVWCAFPRSKAALHGRQHAHARAAAGAPGGNRGRAQDRLTMIDEGGVILVAPAAEHPRIAVELAALEPIRRLPAEVEVAGARALLFGHALYEHLVIGAGIARARVILAAAEAIDAAAAAGGAGGELEAVDRWLAAELAEDRLLEARPLGYPIAALPRGEIVNVSLETP